MFAFVNDIGNHSFHRIFLFSRQYEDFFELDIWMLVLGAVVSNRLPMGSGFRKRLKRGAAAEAV